MKPATEALKQVRFHNPRLARVGVEVMSLQELRQREGAALAAPERVDFVLLLLVEGGQGQHMVDFVEHSLQAGQVLLVRPGQVQQWRLRPVLEGQVVLVSAEALAPSVARAERETQWLALNDWPTVHQAEAALFQAALGAVGRLRADIERFDGSEVAAAIVRHELLALLLRLRRDHGTHHAQAPASRDAEIHRLFVGELEKRFQHRWGVIDFARAIGYSESTLSRACVATVGQTAKQVLDLRIALEAKRLLVHSPMTAAQVGHALGFSEPTNFLKFFRRMVGTTPLAFRAAHAGPPAST